MHKYDLSVIIPSRNEEFVSRTVDGILKSKRGKTEVIVILDGSWTKPPIEDHKDVTIIYHAESIGQRASLNEGVRLSRSKYILKLDAHCIMDDGFDVKLMADCEPNWTVVPRLYNLHAFDWRCKKCKETWYQSPTPKKCKGKKPCDSKEFERVMVWKPRWRRRSDFMRFDTNLKFQYWGALGKRGESQGDIADTMSLLGACFFMERAWYWKIGGSEESWGSWGQQGTEIATKTWLIGGRMVVNKKTWYSHLFRTQGGDFSFPYPQSGNQVARARKASQDMFYKNKLKGQVRPLSWLIEKFSPIANGAKDGVPDWHDKEGKEKLDMVNKEGEKFYKKKGIRPHTKKLTKGIIYYTDNQLKTSISKACKKQIQSIGLPISSASLKPMPGMGNNTHIKLERGWEAYFTQILTALKNLDTDIVYFCEHDWLYHRSHFDFTPPKDDVYYYNDNWWRIRTSDGHAIHYETHLLPAICGNRELLLDHYQQRYDILKKIGFDGKYIYKMGFEPGTHNRAERVDDVKAEGFKSEYPNIDIRHTNNISASRWSKDQFRSQRNCKGWVENDVEIPGWGKNQEVLKLIGVI